MEYFLFGLMITLFVIGAVIIIRRTVTKASDTVMSNVQSENEAAHSTSLTSDIIAAISAAVTVYMGADDYKNGRVRVNRIKRVGTNSPVWTIAAREEQLMNRL